MLTAIEVENFKGIGRRVRIELRPITLLFGPNSAGKSTILHALHYAHEILNRRNFDPDRTHHGGDVVDLGGFRSFVHQHDMDRSVRLRFELDLRGSELVEHLPGESDQMGEIRGQSEESLEFYNDGLSQELVSGWVELAIGWSAVREAAIVRSYEVGVNEKQVARIEASSDGAQVELCQVGIAHDIFFYDGRGGEESVEPEAEMRGEDGEAIWIDLEFKDEEKWGDEVRIPCRGTGRSALPVWGREIALDLSASEHVPPLFGEREFRSRISALLVGVGQLLRDEIGGLRYLGPMRDVLPRMYAPSRIADATRWASGFAAWDLLRARGAEFTREVSDWLAKEDRLGTGYSLGLRSYRELADDSPLMAAIRHGTLLDDIDDVAKEITALPARTELQLVDAKSGLAVQPSDVGVGISQVLPVVVAALDPERPGLTAIEQPELHIHPRVQVELGDLFAHQAVDGRVFLLETHSEHLMLRLLRRIRETSNQELPEGATPLQPGDVSVVYVEQVDGEVGVSRLRIDATGEFVDHWPKGFFEEREDEL